jgi:hypothetical protein
MQSACQISTYAHYARTPVVQLKQGTDDFEGVSKASRSAAAVLDFYGSNSYPFC